MSKIILSTDIEDADIVNLRIGDIYLSGTLVPHAMPFTNACCERP